MPHNNEKEVKDTCCMYCSSLEPENVCFKPSCPCHTGGEKEIEKGRVIGSCGHEVFLPIQTTTIWDWDDGERAQTTMVVCDKCKELYKDDVVKDGELWDKTPTPLTGGEKSPEERQNEIMEKMRIKIPEELKPTPQPTEDGKITVSEATFYQSGFDEGEEFGRAQEREELKEMIKKIELNPNPVIYSDAQMTFAQSAFDAARLFILDKLASLEHKEVGHIKGYTERDE
jgi:hypothetical protein